MELDAHSVAIIVLSLVDRDYVSPYFDSGLGPVRLHVWVNGLILDWIACDKICCFQKINKSDRNSNKDEGDILYIATANKFAITCHGSMVRG